MNRGAEGSLALAMAAADSGRAIHSRATWRRACLPLRWTMSPTRPIFDSDFLLQNLRRETFVILEHEVQADQTALEEGERGRTATRRAGGEGTKRKG